MAEAIKIRRVQDVENDKAKEAKKTAARLATVAPLQNKTFSQLTPTEKDDLLKQLLLLTGMIKDDPSP